MNQESDYKKYDQLDIHNIPIESIIIDDENIVCDKESVDRLKKAIVNNDVVKPIVLISLAHDKLHLVYGIDIFKAYVDLEKNYIPSKVINGDTDDIKIMKIIFREDTLPIKRSMAMQIYLNKYNLSRKKFGNIIDLKVNTISEILSLNKLSDEIKKVISYDARFSLHTLRELARIKDENTQIKKFNEIKQKIDQKYSNTNLNVSLDDLDANNLREDGNININENNKDNNTENFYQVQTQIIFDKKFDNDIMKGYFSKVISEIKKIRTLYGKIELKKIKREINDLNEELKALRYKISDSITLEDD